MDSPLPHAIRHTPLLLLPWKIVHTDDARKAHGTQACKIIFQETLLAMVHCADRNCIRVFYAFYQNPSPLVIPAYPHSGIYIVLSHWQARKRDSRAVLQLQPGICQEQALGGIMGVTLFIVQRTADEFQF